MYQYYRIVSVPSLTELEQEVNGLIRQGWQPLGGISSIEVKLDDNNELDEDGTYTILHMQAMVR